MRKFYIQNGSGQKINLNDKNSYFFSSPTGLGFTRSITYNTDGSGYTDTGLSISGTSGGYISKTKMTEYGEFPIVASGSETTFQPDGCWWNTSQLNFLLWGAACHNGLHVGAAFGVADPFAYSAWSIGPSPAYKRPKAA